MNQTTVHLVFTLVFIIIVTAFIASLKPNILKERFENSKNDALVLSERIWYLKAGLVNFFAQEKNVATDDYAVFKTFANNTIYFHPNDIDICCKATQGKMNCDCPNISIHTSSVPDNTIKFFSEETVSTLFSQLPTSDERNAKCVISGNHYKILKRGIKLRALDKIEEVAQVGSEMYRIDLLGNIATFVLSRPVFIMMNDGGLYKVLYGDKKETPLSKFPLNIFANYDGASPDPACKENCKKYYSLYLKRIKNDDFDGNFMYTEVDRPLKLVDKSEMKDVSFISTIYYLTYSEEITTSGLTTNTVTLFLDKNMIKEIFEVNSNITIATDAKDNSNVTSITLEQERNGDIKFIVNGKDEIKLPESFPYNKKNEYGLEVLEKFHIIFTYSYDVVTLVCIGLDEDNRKNYITMERHHMDKSFKMKKDTLITFLHSKKLAGPSRYLFIDNSLKEVLGPTSIPNYAVVAHRLGYSFQTV